MFKRITAGVLSILICSSALTSGALAQSARTGAAGVLNSAAEIYDVNIPVKEGNTSDLTIIRSVPDKSAVIESEALGENITAEIYSNGLLRICGYGEMTEFKKSPFKNAQSVKQILFEDKDAENGLVITSIGSNVFSGMSSLKCSSCGSADKAAAGVIVLPDGIKSIGSGAFSGCSDIAALTVPDPVETMGGQMLKGCTALRELTIPYAAVSKEEALDSKAGWDNSVADLFMHSYYSYDNKPMQFSDYAIEKITVTGGGIIPDYAFSGMETIKEIDLSGSGVSSVGKYAFNGCTSLESISLPSSLETINDLAFSDCKALKELKLNDGLKSIVGAAFQNCTGITELTIPDSVTSMGEHMLKGCTALKELSLPYAATSNTVAAADGETDWNTSVADMFLSNYFSFYNDNADFSDYAIEKITIRGGEVIPKYAFSGMTTVREIDLSGTKITSIGDYAFWNCSVLTDVKLPETVESLGSYSYYGNPITALPDNGKITSAGSYAFAECENLGEFTIPKTYNSFGEYAFQNCKGIEKLTVPATVTSMGSQMFNGCTNLKELTIPYAATSEAVAAADSKADWNNSVADLFMHSYYSYDNINMEFYNYAIEKITVTGGEVIPDYAFSGMTTVREIDLSGSGVSSVGDYAFRGCIALENLELPETVESIGVRAFNKCTGMKEFRLNDGLKSIGKGAFGNCTMHSLTIPDSVTSMGELMLNGCCHLESLTVPYAALSNGVAAINGKERWWDSVADMFFFDYGSMENDNMDFAGYSISKITVTGGEKIPKYAFSGMKTLREVEICGSETAYIEEYAFNNCETLVSVEVPENVTEIKQNAFANSNADVYIYNKSCDIAYNAMSDDYIGTVHGYEKSTAATFAADNDYKFVPFDNEIVIGPKDISMINGDKYTIKSDHTDLGYSSSDTAVAAVDRDGVISAAEPGKAVISVQAPDGSTCTVNVEVRVPATTTTTTTGAVNTTTTTTTAATTTTTSTTTTTTAAVSTKDPMVAGDLSVSPMTKEEIKKAGIDISGDENFNGIKYSVDAKFDSTKLFIEKNEVSDPDGDIVYKNTRMKIAGGRSIDLDKEAEGQDKHEGVYIDELGSYVYHAETLDEEMFLFINGSSRWLKEFYDVQLLVFNKGGGTVTDCKAALDVPDGLTLVYSEQVQKIGDLDKNKTLVAHWFLRGDREDEYELSAVFEGSKNGDPDDKIKMTFKAKDKFHVYTSGAVDMNIVLPKYSYYNHDYVIKINLKNISKNTIYDLDCVVDKKYQLSKAVITTTDDSQNTITETKYDTIYLMGRYADDQKLRMVVLPPNETVTLEFTVQDLWKSVYEQYITSAIFDEKEKELLSMINADNNLLGIREISNRFAKYFSELPTEHILKCIEVGFEGSQAPVSYSVDIDTKTNAPTERKIAVSTEYVRDRLKMIFDGSFDTETDLEQLRKDYIVNIDIKDEESASNAIIEYYNKKSASEPQGIICIRSDNGDDILFFEKYGNWAEVSLKVRTRGEEENENIPVTVTGSAVEITDIYGNTSGKDGKLEIPEGDDIIRIKVPKTFESGDLIFEYKDGTKEVQRINMIDAHQCVSTGRYEVVKTPDGDEPGLAIRVCDICGEITDCCPVNCKATAMLSNSNTYADIRVAVKEAADAGESTELTLFGDIDVTDNVTIPEYVDVLIADNAVINIKDGCRLIAEGKVTDLSGRGYDLGGGDTSVPETTTTTAAATAPATTTTTTTVTTTTVTTTASTTTTTAATTVTTPSTAAMTSSTTTAAATVTSDMFEDIGTPKQLAEWAVVDYQYRNGKHVRGTDINTTDSGVYEITLKDADGNVLDIYYIDPQTGEGTNSADESVDLPQTGSNSKLNMIIVFASLMMVILGMVSVKMSKDPEKFKSKKK
ncbi:leucine-rich repeat domain-containing protein [Ruminococcus sp.]|uniref:leucine-rich repeat domain-containing protein n=1 Tax=Ruminococcus sp. TaxID=41978 RepID=UPI0025F59456|nr:leucine-rich repeat domain-containing protein [Ruminococcus sp.]